MKKAQTLSAFCFLLFSAAAIAQEGAITVKVSNIPSTEGQIRAALFDSPEGFPDQVDQSVRNSSVVVDGDSVTLTFPDVAYGEYVLAVFHDENNNGALDTNNRGIPLEALGVSGDAKMAFGPPKYEKAAFEVSGQQMEIEISLQQFKAGANN